MIDGFYTFLIDINIHKRSYLYKGYFNPYNPLENLFSSIVAECSDGSSQLNDYLLSNVTYILVVTTFNPIKIVGSYRLLITVSGVSNVTLKSSISEYLVCCRNERVALFIFIE
jgi:hypothetical protein